ncbi:BnaC08g02550D [Brassica napus]|uniref:BnaC08g02550D protein n=1 Tax=Brassica napus TaxID=3708 RepID=A0A078H7J2_BRANA|nr:BnaC08g02550D [Brassica napus]
MTNQKDEIGSSIYVIRTLVDPQHRYTSKSGYQVERVYPDIERMLHEYGRSVFPLKAFSWKPLLWAEAHVSLTQGIEQTRLPVEARSVATSLGHRSTYLGNEVYEESKTAYCYICNKLFSIGEDGFRTRRITSLCKLPRRYTCLEEKFQQLRAHSYTTYAEFTGGQSSTQCKKAIVWLWMGLDGQWWEHSTYGDKKLHST